MNIITYENASDVYESEESTAKFATYHGARNNKARS